VGLDLIYKSDGREFDIRFSMADWETIDRMRPHLPDAIAAMADVPDFGEEVRLPLGELRDAIEQIDRFLRDRPEVLPYTYEFKTEYIVVGDQRIEFDEFSTGGQSGFRLRGDEEHWYAIWAGLDECRLDKMAVQPDGTGKVVEQRDLRGESELQTANCGRVQIRKRRTKSSLRKGLAMIRKYLASLPEGAEVTKIVC
jgi:hypothetical protein